MLDTAEQEVKQAAFRPIPLPSREAEDERIRASLLKRAAEALETARRAEECLSDHEAGDGERMAAAARAALKCGATGDSLSTHPGAGAVGPAGVHLGRHLQYLARLLEANVSLLKSRIAGLAFLDRDDGFKARVALLEALPYALEAAGAAAEDWRETLEVTP